MMALIGINHYYSIKAQALRNVLIYSPSIIAVKSGHKKLQWRHKTLDYNNRNWLIVPANQRLTFVNTPSLNNREGKEFRSTQVSFLSPPSQALMAQSCCRAISRSVPPLLKMTPQLNFSFTQLLEMVKYDLTVAVQQHYLDGFYQQLLEAGALHLLFPSSQPSSSEQLSCYLAANPAAAHSIEKACEYFSISKSTLCRRLAKEKSSFRMILREVRMSHALTLMQKKEGFYPQLDLAMNCGYQSEARFAQRFQRQFGLTPKQYQKTLYAQRKV